MFETETTWYFKRDWDDSPKLRHIQDDEYNTLVAKSEQMKDIEDLKATVQNLKEQIVYLEDKCDFLESQCNESYYDG